MATVVATQFVEKIAKRNPGRSEAQLQAEIYGLLTVGALNLAADDVAQLEVPTQDGSRRRLDVEVGRCCIEVKRDLRFGNVLTDAREQLAGYVTTRAQRLGGRYVGIVTDGVSWYLHHLVEGVLEPIVEFKATPDDADGLLTWLESVLATNAHVQPTPDAIAARLGAESPAHQLDHASLSALYEAAQGRPEVQLKRDLWAKLLRTAFGSAFNADSRLFIDHTLLVLTAEAIAHGVIGFDLTSGGLTPQDIARGSKFHDAQIYGVVEEDFFDWVLDVDGGPAFISELARRVGRFDWSGTIRHDVLKALYTSVIPQSDREALGEYYTPDWLAERVVAATYDRPLQQRLLEPACGSGTFLLHAVLRHLDAAEAAGLTSGQAVRTVVDSVIGMDVHPVSVILARVTYLLGIGRTRLNAPDRGPLTIPVYLGDSVQWEQRTDLVASLDNITISTAGDDLVSGGGGALFGDDLVFPRSILKDAATFDQLVSTMADKARAVSNKSSADLITPTLVQLGVHASDRAVVVQTFDTMRRLHGSGRDHIWGYYVRNLIRPLWLAEPANKVDVLVSNVPWLRYSKMTESMQDRYKTLARDRNLLTGGLGASGRDLATLFVVRSVELYLKSGGRFAFVMPYPTLTRKPHTGFRSGEWGSKSLVLKVKFEPAWDLSEASTGFPMTSCVVHGVLAASAQRLPASTLKFVGKLRNPDVPWAIAQRSVVTSPGSLTTIDAGALVLDSPYRKAFRQGAILVPRFLLFVDEERHASPLGPGAGRVSVVSARSNLEKRPWRDMEGLSGNVESRYVRDTLLGESVGPYRLLGARKAVLPISDTQILSAMQVATVPGLAKWWEAVEASWEVGRKPSEKAPLLERFDFHAQFSSQLPAATHRVVYSGSGSTLVAARVEDPRAVIEHSLYWGAVSSRQEGQYLTAILNSDALRELVVALQTKGLYGPRHFDKYVFNVPIATYNPNDPNHVALADLASTCEIAAAAVNVGDQRFRRSRTLIRDALIAQGLHQRVESAVRALLGTAEDFADAGAVPALDGDEAPF